MHEHCFYCENEVGQYKRYATFTLENQHIEKPMCSDCYEDWLEGIKE